jgi:uncharacterized protein (DUF697 family)
MQENPSSTLQQAHAIARRYSLISLGVGLVPLPLVDLAALSALQLAMIRELCRCYGLSFYKNRTRHLITALVGSGSSVALARGVGLYATGHALPLRLLGLGGVGLLGGASTQALARVFILHFEAGGSILDFDPQRMRDHYLEELRKNPGANSLASPESFVGIRP